MGHFAFVALYVSSGSGLPGLQLVRLLVFFFRLANAALAGKCQGKGPVGINVVRVAVDRLLVALHGVRDLAPGHEAVTGAGRKGGALVIDRSAGQVRSCLALRGGFPLFSFVGKCSGQRDVRARLIGQ
jgi:hypothetical protein